MQRGQPDRKCRKSANYYTDDEKLEGPYFDEDPLNNNDSIIPGSEIGIENNDNFNNNDKQQNYNDKDHVNNSDTGQ